MRLSWRVLPATDDFSTSKLGVQWSFFTPGAEESQRLRYEEKSVVIEGKGSSAADCSPLTCIVGDRSYEATVSLEITGDAQGGLVLFYDSRGFVGVGFTSTEMLTYNYGQEQRWLVFGGFLSLRLGLFSAGRGAIRARNFTYRSLES